MSAPASSSPTPATVTPEEVRAWFHRDVAPAPVPFTYQVALAATAVALVLLPLVYLGLVLAVAWGVWWWMSFGLVVFQTNTSIWSLLLYLTPLCAGAILVAFLFKPFFAPRAPAAQPVEVDLATEPALRTFLEEICRRVGVPLPTAVRLDSASNASASFRHGWRSLGRRDLALTLGTPFIRNLTAQQLGGIIAHEFGHFAQRGGMFSSYVIASINGWFGAVVFGRDRWDDWLVRQSRELDFRLGAMLWCARGGVWVSRKLLHGLMYVAHALSCWLSRQMEFDADYYAVQVQGAESFATTMRTTSLISVAEQRALADLGSWWNERKVVPDLAAHTAYRFQSLEPAVGEHLDRTATEEKTRWHFTHPVTRERVARARELDPAPALVADTSATRLFGDFAARSRDVTAAFYRHALGSEFERAQALDDAETAARAARDDAAAAALHRLCGGCVGVDRPVVLTLAEIGLHASVPAATADEHARWFEAHGESLRPAYTEDSAAFDRRVQLQGVRRFLHAGIAVKAATFELKAPTLAAVDEAMAAATAITERHEPLLRDFAERLRLRLRGLARSAHTQAGSPAAAQVLARLETFALLSPCFTHLPKLLSLHGQMVLFEANREGLGDNKAFLFAFDGLRDEIRQSLKQCLAAAESVPDPFAPASDGPAPSVRQTIERAHPPSDLVTECTGRLNAVIALHFRLLREIAAAGDSLERPAA